MNISGLSLVEIIVVMAILAILFGIGLISYLDFRDRRLVDDAAYSAVQAVTRAVAETRKTSDVTKLIVNPGAKAVQVQSAAGTVLYERVLAVMSVTLSCGGSTCGTSTKTFNLLAPAGVLSEDFSITLARGTAARSVKFLGPNAMVVYQ